VQNESENTTQARSFLRLKFQTDQRGVSASSNSVETGFLIPPDGLCASVGG